MAIFTNGLKYVNWGKKKVVFIGGTMFSDYEDTFRLKSNFRGGACSQAKKGGQRPRGGNSPGGYVVLKKKKIKNPWYHRDVGQQKLGILSKTDILRML